MSGTRLELSPSWPTAAAIVALHAAAAAAAFALLASPAAYALGLALMALGLAAAWSRALLLSAASVRWLELSDAGLVIGLRNGRSAAVELGAARHVGRFMVTLPVRRPLRRTILVTCDMLDGEAFRRLRLWALWGRLPARVRAVAGKQLSA